MTNFSLTLYLLKTLREESKSGQIKIYKKATQGAFFKSSCKQIEIAAHGTKPPISVSTEETAATGRYSLLFP